VKLRLGEIVTPDGRIRIAGEEYRVAGSAKAGWVVCLERIRDGEKLFLRPVAPATPR
jgi:hypothetical protein